MTAGNAVAGELYYASENPSPKPLGPTGAPIANGSYLPTYAVLDVEGYFIVNTDSSPAYNDLVAMIQGWAEGIRANSLLVSPAYYESQSPIEGCGLPTSAYVDGFSAVSPILNTSPDPAVSSSLPIGGYIAYYAGCPASAYKNTVWSWGRAYNTLQFPGSGVSCGT